MRKLNPLWVLIAKDQMIKWLLLRLCACFCLVLTLCGGYLAMDLLLIPYYQSQQSFHQQLRLENELYKISLNERERWQNYEKMMPLFGFSDDKIKIALKLLCKNYNLTVLACRLSQEEKQEMLIKPGVLTVTSLLDSRIFSFLQHLNNKLSGVLAIKMIKLHRSRELTKDLLAKIKSGQVSDLVEATIEFEWLVF